MRQRSGVRREKLLFSLATCVSLIAILAVALPTVAQGATTKEIDQAVEARESFGLPAGRQHVEDLMGSLDNSATEKYGFPLTDKEYDELLSRTWYVREFRAQTLPYVEQLDGYAGHWVDQTTGRIVVALTNVTESVKSQVRDRLPEDNLGVRFEEVNDSASALRSALNRSDTEWAYLKTGVDVQAFAMRFRENRLVVKVLKNDFEKAKSQKAPLEKELGVDVGFEVSAPIVDSSCPSRHKCFGPLQLGVRMNHPNVYDSSAHYSQWNCAVGFMLTDQQILTAGHCTYGRQEPWKGHQNYQDAYGRIGERVSSRYDSTDQRDLSIISLEDWPANKTKRLYGDDEWPTVLTMEDAPTENMGVCVSLNRQDKDLSAN